MLNDNYTQAYITLRLYNSYIGILCNVKQLSTIHFGRKKTGCKLHGTGRRGVGFQCYVLQGLCTTVAGKEDAARMQQIEKYFLPPAPANYVENKKNKLDRLKIKNKLSGTKVFVPLISLVF